MTTKADTLVQVRVADRTTMDRCLNAAVEKMIEAARPCRHGILVTREGDGLFRVELSDAIPFGYTEELDERNKFSD